MYDIAIIGAGINGTSVAYELASVGKKVIIFDEDSIAGGGSGAAGAFISPKFSKEGELKEILHDAFIYSMDFYEKNFSSLLTKAPLLHIAQDKKSSKILKLFKSTTDLELKTPSQELLNSLTPHARMQENIYLNAGVVNALDMCQALSKQARFVNEKIEDLLYDNGMWILNDTYSAKEVVLATGAYESVLKEPYINLRPVWGHRIDVKTTTKNETSIHQEVSISPSKNGIVAIGATHNVHYHPQTSKEVYNFDEGREELLKKASKTIELENIEILKDYVGLRSGSVDYMPLLGQVVISKETLACGNSRFNVERSKYDEFVYYPNLYMINGSSGYGFVLAPYLARILKEHILSNKKINQRMSPARFFVRWAKKRF
jgi:tRNA 5-methylaminomethyl-2-thiouridine biosynthesis bifunctional protein